MIKSKIIPFNTNIKLLLLMKLNSNSKALNIVGLLLRVRDRSSVPRELVGLRFIDILFDGVNDSGLYLICTN